MNIEQVRDILRTDVATVIFTKKNGDERVMICTTLSEFLPEVASGSTREPSEDIVVCWDLEAQGWRSFNINSLISLETDTELFQGL